MRELREYDALEHEIAVYTKVLECESATRAAFGSQRRYPTTEDVGGSWNSRHIEGSGEPVVHLRCTLYGRPIALPVVPIADGKGTKLPRPIFPLQVFLGKRFS